MRFICAQKELNKAVQTAIRAVPSKAVQPELKALLFSVKGTALTIVGTDMDIGIKVELDVTGNEDGSALVDASMIGKIVGKLPDALVTVSSDKKTFSISALSSEFNITCISGTMPPFPAVGGTSAFKIKADEFVALVGRTSFAASIDAKRGVLQGCLLTTDGANGADMVALDGFRMAMAHSDVDVDGANKAIIKARDLQQIAAILKDAKDAEIDVSLSDKAAKFHFDRITVISRLLEGEYIRYADIIPKSHNIAVVVEVDELRDAIERATILSQGSNNLIKAEISDGIITICANSANGKAAETIEADTEGGDLTIGFNAKYVIDALKSADGFVRWEFTSPLAPSVIRPEEGNAFCHMILPVRLSQKQE